MRKRHRSTIAPVVSRVVVCALAIGAPAAALAGCGGGSAHAPDAATLKTTSSPAAASTAAGTTSASAAARQPTTTPRASVKDPHSRAPEGAAGHTVPGGGQGGAPAGTEPSSGATEDRKGGGSHRGGRGHPGRGSTSKPASANSKPSGSGGGSAPSAAPNSENGVPYEVHNAAMEPTYKAFTTVYYDPTQTKPQIGQVILFYMPAGAEEGTCASPEVGGRACAVASPGLSHNLSLARVVGLPGEEIAIQNGLVVRNGQPVSEPAIQPCGVKELASEPGCEYPKAITVPAGSYYVMADNRLLFQDDSRGFGAVPQEAVVGTLLGS
jgi:signal peptidase I